MVFAMICPPEGTDAPLRPRLCVVSTTSHRAVAGLSAYMRSLLDHARAELDALSIARFELDGGRGLDPLARESPRQTDDELGPLSIVAPRAPALPLLRLVRPLIHREATQRSAVRIFDRAYRHPLDQAAPRRVSLVHFVGAGWELLGFPAMSLARSRGVPFSVTPAMHAGEWGDSPVDALLYRAADAVFALSDHERRRLVELGVDPEKIQLSPLAPAVPTSGDGRRFRERWGLGDRPIVLFTGRKQRYKGFHDTCEGMLAVLEAIPSAVLVTIGASGDEAAVALPEGALLDLGVCDEGSKCDALAASDVFCLPSVGEAFGIAYTEAWVYGKPVVVGPAPASRELVEGAGGGLPVAQVPAEIAAAVTRLLQDADLRYELGEAGRSALRHRYSWDEAWRAHRIAWERIGALKSQDHRDRQHVG